MAVLVVRWESVTETPWDGVMGGVLFREVLRSGVWPSVSGVLISDVS